MSKVVYDNDAWHHYPQHRSFFNKLELSLKLGYTAGPSGVNVPNNNEYIVRPIMNLNGMGVGASKTYITTDNLTAVPPGYFWCEYFYGNHISIDYEWQQKDYGPPVLCPIFAAQGYRSDLELYRFNSWRQIQIPYIPLPEWISVLSDVPRINIEFINDKIIEIHLRAGVDFPPGATEIIPKWSDMPDDECAIFTRQGFKYIDNFDDAEGQLDIKRLGFYYR